MTRDTVQVTRDTHTASRVTRHASVTCASRDALTGQQDKFPMKRLEVPSKIPRHAAQPTVRYLRIPRPSRATPIPPRRRMMSKTSHSRPTLASTNTRIDEIADTLAQILGHFQAPQHSTTTAVAAKVEATPKVEKPKSAADQLKEFAESAGWAFAKGGRVELGLEEMKALSRVLRTGKPEILTISDTRTIAVGRTQDGTRAFTQNLYKPEAK